MEEEEAEDEGFVGYPCFEFNSRLEPHMNDTRCVHCKKYLTTLCEHIDEFFEEEGDGA